MQLYVVQNLRLRRPTRVMGQTLAPARSQGRKELRLTPRQYESAGVQKLLRKGVLSVVRIVTVPDAAGALPAAPETETTLFEVIDEVSETVEAPSPEVQNVEVGLAEEENLAEEIMADLPNYDDMKWADLKALCAEAGLPTSGNKDKLIERLKKRDAHGAEEPPA